MGVCSSCGGSEKATSPPGGKDDPRATEDSSRESVESEESEDLGLTSSEYEEIEEHYTSMLEDITDGQGERERPPQWELSHLRKELYDMEKRHALHMDKLHDIAMMVRAAAESDGVRKRTAVLTAG